MLLPCSGTWTGYTGNARANRVFPQQNTATPSATLEQSTRALNVMNGGGHVSMSLAVSVALATIPYTTNSLSFLLQYCPPPFPERALCLPLKEMPRFDLHGLTVCPNKLLGNSELP